jgi:hypothetical protein
MIGARVFPRVRLDWIDDAGGKAESVRVSSTLASYSRGVKRSSVVLNRGCPGIVGYFGVHGMTKEVQHERQKWMRWSVLTIFSHEKGRSRFCKRL